jgi:hypothetical protein
VIIGFKIQNTIGKLSSQNTAVAPGNLNSGRIVVVRIELEVKGLVVLVTYVMRGDDNIARSLCSSSMPPLVFCIGSPARKEPVTYYAVSTPSALISSDLRTNPARAPSRLTCLVVENDKTVLLETGMSNFVQSSLGKSAYSGGGAAPSVPIRLSTCFLNFARK